MAETGELQYLLAWLPGAVPDCRHGDEGTEATKRSMDRLAPLRQSFC